MPSFGMLRLVASVLTRTSRHNIRADDILYSHSREKPQILQRLNQFTSALERLLDVAMAAHILKFAHRCDFISVVTHRTQTVLLRFGGKEQILQAPATWHSIHSNVRSHPVYCRFHGSGERQKETRFVICQVQGMHDVTSEIVQTK
jgi:hypothetical protein